MRSLLQAALFRRAAYSTPKNAAGCGPAEARLWPRPTRSARCGNSNRWTLDVDAYYSHFQNPYATTPDINRRADLLPDGSFKHQGRRGGEQHPCWIRDSTSTCNGTTGTRPNTRRPDLWVANAPRNTEGGGSDLPAPRTGTWASSTSASARCTTTTAPSIRLFPSIPST